MDKESSCGVTTNSLCGTKKNPHLYTANEACMEKSLIVNVFVSLFFSGTIIFILFIIKNQIKMAQTQIAASLQGINEHLDKVHNEVSGLKESFAELEQKLAATTEVSPEVQALLDEISGKIQSIDDMNTDVEITPEPVEPTEPTEPEPTEPTEPGEGEQ